MSTSKFIVVEGGEGAGKSTQLKAIQSHFGDTVLVTREPGGSPYAEEIRDLILKSKLAPGANAQTFFNLFWGARADHLHRKIKPALDKGIHVISDRFDSSTFAYQIFGQEAKELLPFFWQTREFNLGTCKPDLYIYLDVEIEKGLARKHNQGGDEINHFDLKKIDFHTRQREGYLEFFKHVPHVIIDANRSEEEVKNDLIKELNSVGIIL